MSCEEANWEKEVSQEPSYHGYLPREDLPYILDKNGDYLLRITEINLEAQVAKRKKELVLAVLIDPEAKTQGEKQIDFEVKDSMIKNVIINRVNGRFTVEAGLRFENITMLLRHYSNSPLRMSTGTVLLTRAVRLMRWEFLHSVSQKLLLTLLQFQSVSMGKVLGSGAFGEVHKGILKKKNGKTITVAIKSLKTSAATKEQNNEMMREARLMRNLYHSNVVQIHGVALCEQPLYILLEFVRGGSLDSYLKKHANVLDRDEKLQMMMGAVWGLEYLHSAMILHRDIASRNCLYDENKNVKISDFGLSRQGTLYKMKTAKRMPIKWMSPESINQFIFSQKTDVYSMGVLIYEIFACKESYDGLSNTESRRRINEDKWNEFPANTPSKLVAYVKEKMWAKDPTSRANMQYIRQWLETYTGLTKVEEMPTDTGQVITDKADKLSLEKTESRSRRVEKKEPEDTLLNPEE